MPRDKIILTSGLALGAVVGALAMWGGANLPISVAFGFLTASIVNLVAAGWLLR